MKLQGRSGVPGRAPLHSSSLSPAPALLRNPQRHAVRNGVAVVGGGAAAEFVQHLWGRMQANR